MIKEAYCSYEVSRLLKEKGFNEKTFTFYIKGQPYNLQHNFRGNKFSNSEMENVYSSPTHQMVMKWLREVHKVLIVIDAYHADHWEGYIDSFEINIYSHASTIIVPNEIAHHTDYEDAVESAIKYCLENLI